MPLEKLEAAGACLVDAIERGDWPLVSSLIASRKALIQELRPSLTAEEAASLAESNARAQALLESRRKSVCSRLAKMTSQKRAAKAYRQAG